MTRHRTVLALPMMAVIAGCGPAPGNDANDKLPAATLQDPDLPNPETQADAVRRVAEEAERRGAPGVTEPVYDPRLADQPGRTWQTRAELEADRAMDDPSAK